MQQVGFMKTQEFNRRIWMKRKRFRDRNQDFQTDPYLPKENKAKKCQYYCMKEKHTRKKSKTQAH